MLRETQRKHDPEGRPKRAIPGTKGMRTAKKFEAEMKRKSIKHSKEDLHEAHEHMKKHGK